jgi:hypothetical protein
VQVFVRRAQEPDLFQVTHRVPQEDFMVEEPVAFLVPHRYQEVDSPGVAFLLAAVPEAFLAAVASRMVVDHEAAVEVSLVAADMSDGANEDQTPLEA